MDMVDCSGLRKPIFGLVAFLLVGYSMVAGVEGQAEDAKNQELTFKLSNDDYWVSETFSAKSTSQVEMSANEQEGRVFDIFLMKTSMLDTYKRVLQQGGGIRYYDTHSRLASHNLTIDEIMPNVSGTFIYLIDNTEAPDDGGYANHTLNLTFKLKVSESSPTNGILPVGATLAGSALIMAGRKSLSKK